MKRLYANLVKLGSTNPELRPHIRPILKSAGYQDQFDVPSEWEDDHGKIVYQIDNGLQIVDSHGRMVDLDGREADEYLGIVEKMIKELRAGKIREDAVDRRLYSLNREFSR